MADSGKPAAKTLAPAEKKASAMASPMPLPPPVIRTDFPEKSNIPLIVRERSVDMCKQRRVRAMKRSWRSGICFLVLLIMGNKGMGHSQPNELVENCLQAHNAVRAQLGERQLRWSNELASEAQWWANVLAEKNQFAHEPYRQWGQNLFLIDGGYSTPGQAVAAWAAEASDYDRQDNRCIGDMCGHYTQLVWRDTREVGCGHAWRGMREVWVCNYFPPGNVVGERPY